MADDPKTQVAKAIKILNDKCVGQNICGLINVYGFEGEDIVLDKNVPCPEKIGSQLKIEKVDKSYLFKFGEDSLQIIIANLRSSSFTDSDLIYGDVLVYIKNECVLHNSINKEYEEWGSTYKISFYDFSIKKLKLGTWIDHLSFLVKRIAEIKKERERLKEEKNLKKTAAGIDLGDYDPNK